MGSRIWYIPADLAIGVARFPTLKLFSFSWVLFVFTTLGELYSSPMSYRGNRDFSGRYSSSSDSSPPGRGRGRGGCCGGGGGGSGRGNQRGPPTCFRCGEIGHTSNTCTSEKVLEQKTFVSQPMPRHTVSFIDTHCHVDYICEQARTATWAEFKAKNPLPKTYDGCITTYCDSTAICSSFSQYGDLSTNHPDVYHTWGLHPHNAKYWNERIENRILEMVTNDLCVGYGEIGLDATSEKKGGSEADEQLVVFTRQLELAAMVTKPIIIHYRGDGSLLSDLLAPLPSTQKLHLHCWGDPSVDTAQRLMKQFPNLYFGFTGGIFAGMKMNPLLRALPSDRFVLESDGPYMLPPSLRPPKGQGIICPVNHPGNIPYIAERIAEVRGVTIDRVLKDAQINTGKLYGIGKGAPQPSPLKVEAQEDLAKQKAANAKEAGETHQRRNGGDDDEAPPPAAQTS